MATAGDVGPVGRRGALSLCVPFLLLSVLSPAAGSPLGAADRTAVFSPEQRDHWAFRPVELPPVPSLAGCANPIDAFVLARLRARGLDFSPEADRRTLIRRVTIDLTGLPPTAAEVEAFAADRRPDAYERLVDRLLASPRHGERWARHWLDLVRYAESDGFKSDVYRPGSWRYRDYVIDAFNGDRPYDRFVMEQLAGDELWPGDARALIATGFLRHWAYEDNGRDLDRAWAAILNDVTDVTGEVFLGLTIGCARCHDHKFDPILQEDYFNLQAFFAAMVPRNDLPVGPPPEMDAYRAAMARWLEATADLRRQRDELQEPFFREAQQAKGGKFPPLVKAILAKPERERTLYERQLVTLAGNQLRVDMKSMASRMTPEVRSRWEALNHQIAAFDDLKPPSLPVARGVRDIGPQAPPLLLPGRGKEARPAFLTVLGGGSPRIEPIEPSGPSPTARDRGAAPASTGRRAALARWIARGDHPLTARVLVNRIWQHHLGRGIVATPGDFGTRAPPPTHPRLLDWLARRLVDEGWSIKRLHRLIVTSRMYRQTSTPAADAAGFTVDPRNTLLWRMATRRVEAEVMRDVILAASGELNLEMGGRSVFPKLPEGLTGRYGWKPTGDPAARARRTIYLAVKRNMHLPLLKTFDVPDNHHPCADRVRTTTPTQALILLNEPWVLERARRIAGRVLAAARGDRGLEALARVAYEIILARPAARDEAALAARFLARQRALIAERIAAGETVYAPAGSGGADTDLDAALGAALVDLCHTLVNTNEFLYVD